MTTITVIVPTRNSHHLLARLVSSLQAQSWPHWRVLFIDGNSEEDHIEWLTHLCDLDNRFSWQQQDVYRPGIFGAMNQGFSLSSADDWLLFWGSDDWAASATIFDDLVAAIDEGGSTGEPPDLLVGWGRYVDLETEVPGRLTCFDWHMTFRRSLFLGFTPPHQATLIGPGARAYLSTYHPWFRLSADLDYFLKLSTFPRLTVKLVDVEVVRMGSGGISARQTSRRLHEVFHAYHSAFGWLWWIPFTLRYVHRLRSKWEA